MALLQQGQANGAAADSISPIHVLPPIVDGIGSKILGYAVLLAAIATIVMAMLELIKGVLRLRKRFHHWHLRRWVEAGGGTSPRRWRYDLRQSGADPQALIELQELCAVDGQDMGAILELPTDEMVGHLRSAAGVAIDFPGEFPHLNAFLTTLTPGMAAEWDRLSTAINGEEHTARASNVDTDGADSTRHDRRDDREGEWNPDAIRARAKIDHFVTRRLDAFETHLEYWWARWNQYAAVSGGTLLIALVLASSGGGWSVGRVIQTGLLSVFGGMLAPFAKDVVSALINLRARTA